jgi:hypothetical protein
VFFTASCGGADEGKSGSESSWLLLLHGGFLLLKSFSLGQVAQWLTVGLSSCGIGSIGIALPLGVPHHSIGR